MPGNSVCFSRDEWKCFWSSRVEERVAEYHEDVIEEIKPGNSCLCEKDC